MELISDFAAAEARQRFQVSLLPVFDEIAHTFLKASHGKVHTSLQSYLDGPVSIGDAYFTRRAILLAIHDMKDELEAPLALQETNPGGVDVAEGAAGLAAAALS